MASSLGAMAASASTVRVADGVTALTMLARGAASRAEGRGGKRREGWKGEGGLVLKLEEIRVASSAAMASLL